MKKIIGLIFVSLFTGLIAANAQQTETANQSKFKTFLDRKDSVILTKSHKVESCSCAAVVAWIDGEKEKTYAANFYGVYVDFEKLGNLRDQVENLTQTIEKSFNDSSLTVNYSAAAYDFYVNYYTFADSKNDLQKNIYIKFGSTVFQSKTTEKLKTLSKDIKLAQEKLVLLGAK